MSDSLVAPAVDSAATISNGPSYVAGALLGGTTMSVLSAAGALALEQKKPTPKTMARDFILGAILLIFILQLLPESTGKLIAYVTSFIAIPTAISTGSLSSLTGAVTAAVSDDVEVKVGVPRF